MDRFLNAVLRRMETATGKAAANLKRQAESMIEESEARALAVMPRRAWRLVGLAFAAGLALGWLAGRG